MDVDRLAFPEDLAVVRLVDTRDALGEDGFAGAVVAAQGRDLAGGEVEVDAIQRLHGSEVLVDAADLEERLGHLRHLRHSAPQKEDAAAHVVEISHSIRPA